MKKSKLVIILIITLMLYTSNVFIGVLEQNELKKTETLPIGLYNL
ncbi:MAG: hypothetical protein ACOC4G_05285 [Bacillota bacterium]